MLFTGAPPSPSPTASCPKRLLPQSIAVCHPAGWLAAGIACSIYAGIEDQRFFNLAGSIGTRGLQFGVIEKR
jgi:hypothetical protein